MKQTVIEIKGCNTCRFCGISCNEDGDMSYSCLLSGDDIKCNTKPAKNCLLLHSNILIKLKEN